MQLATTHPVSNTSATAALTSKACHAKTKTAEATNKIDFAAALTFPVANVAIGESCCTTAMNFARNTDVKGR